jgi:outer membrane protein OmpA-like peptidoglycan-associated protein
MQKLHSFFGMVFFSLFLTAQAQKNKPKGSLVDESETYNIDVLKAIMKFNFIDADDQQPTSVSLLIRNVLDKKDVFKTENSQQIEVELRRKQAYNLYVSSPKYIDTVVFFDLNKEIPEEQTILLRPKREDFEINISDMETGDNLPFGVTLTNKNRNEVINLDPKDGNNGKYKVRLREDDEYEVEVKNPKEYLFYSNTVSTKKSKSLDAKMHNLSVGAKIQLYNITFATGSWELNANSRRELDRITKLLNDHPTLKIEIAGHTDNVGTAKKNMELSLKRAKAVHNYLIAKKIPEKRFIAKGYGQEKPIADNSTEEGRAKNRRFELIVLSL